MAADSFLLKPGQTWVMLGDSITEDPDGYVGLCEQMIARGKPDLAVRIFNAGVSGNRACDMLARFDVDVLSHSPDLVSINAGINDVWHGFYDFDNDQPRPSFSDTHGSGMDRFTDAITKMLLLARDKGVSVLLIAPTIIGDDPISRENAMLREYVSSLEKLAEQFGAHYCPMHDLCWTTLRAGRSVKPSFDITWDGVHMNKLGAQMMAVGVLHSVGFYEIEADNPEPLRRQ